MIFINLPHLTSAYTVLGVDGLCAQSLQVEDEPLKEDTVQQSAQSKPVQEAIKAVASYKYFQLLDYHFTGWFFQCEV